MQVAVRIALLFASWGSLRSSDLVRTNSRLDVAVTTGDFAMPMAVWYARQMGLPIGNIICGCNDNGKLWDLLHHGQLHTDSSIPSNLERLISATLGTVETKNYLQICEKAGIYTLDEEQLAILNDGLSAAVVSEKRMESVIHNVYNASGYLLGPCSALAYGSLQDYRAKKTEIRSTLIFSERSPLCDCTTVSKALDLTEKEIRDICEMN
jgi:threonine synthase